MFMVLRARLKRFGAVGTLERTRASVGVHVNLKTVLYLRYWYL